MKATIIEQKKPSNSIEVTHIEGGVYMKQGDSLIFGWKENTSILSLCIAPGFAIGLLHYARENHYVFSEKSKMWYQDICPLTDVSNMITDDQLQQKYIEHLKRNTPLI